VQKNAETHQSSQSAQRVEWSAHGLFNRKNLALLRLFNPRESAATDSAALES
jgi:hypothetical protein